MGAPLGCNYHAALPPHLRHFYGTHEQWMAAVADWMLIHRTYCEAGNGCHIPARPLTDDQAAATWTRVNTTVDEQDRQRNLDNRRTFDVFNA